jgi:hypothetical protein
VDFAKLKGLSCNGGDPCHCLKSPPIRHVWIWPPWAMHLQDNVLKPGSETEVVEQVLRRTSLQAGDSFVFAGVFITSGLTTVICYARLDLALNPKCSRRARSARINSVWTDITSYLSGPLQ